MTWFGDALLTELGNGLKTYRAEPWRLLLDAATWLSMMAIMFLPGVGSLPLAWARSADALVHVDPNDVSRAPQCPLTCV